MDKHISSTQKIYTYVIILLICIISITAAIMRCADLIKNNYLDQAKRNLADISIHNSEYLKDQIEMRYELLESIAKTLDLEPDKRKELIYLFKPVAESFNLKRIGFCDENGIAYATEGAPVNLSYRDFFQHSMAGEVYLSDVIKDAMDSNHEAITTMTMPIHDKDSNINGVAAITYTIENLNKELSIDIFEGAGSNFVFSDTGFINISSNPSILGIYDNIYDLLWAEMGYNYKSRNQLLSEIIDKSENENYASGTITIKGIKYYYHITPLSLKHIKSRWHVISIVPEEYLNQRFESTKKNLFRMEFFIFIFCFVSLFLLQLVSIRSQRFAKKLAFTSLVTGGPNDAKLAYIINKNHMNHGFLVHMAIENFKHTSLAIGPDKTQKLLKNTWTILLKNEKRGDYFCHSQDDHFVLFMGSTSDDELIVRLLDLQEKIHNEGLSENVSFIDPKFGISQIINGETAEDSMRKAEIAVSLALNSDEDFTFYDEERQQQHLHNQEIEDYFDTAIKKKELYIYYQPKVSAKTKLLTGAEALVRWNYKGTGIIRPDEFIPLLEQSGSIVKLDEYIFRSVCEKQAEWIKKGYKVVPISVNISKATLFQDNIVKKYLRIIEENELEPKYIQLEVTETLSSENFYSSLLNEFRYHGIKILMDDFGAGYTPLSLLNMRCFDTLKIDKSLVDNIQNTFGKDLLASVILMTKHLGYYLTAEGVEDESQYEFLKSIKCDDIQGYLFAKPEPEYEFQKRLV